MPSDAWSNPSAISAEDAARMAAFLEDRAARPDQILVNTALRDALTPRPGSGCVEVGCGSGVLCRLVAPGLLPGGEMLGLDVAPDMVAAARALAGQQAEPALRGRRRRGAAGWRRDVRRGVRRAAAAARGRSGPASWLRWRASSGRAAGSC